MASVHTITVTLCGTRPPIWRRLEVASTVTLAGLSGIVQSAFGWAGHHLWVFETGDDEFGLPDPEADQRDATRTRLRAVAPSPGDRLRYTYDFGDDWQHDLVVEAVGPAQPGTTYPRCTGGDRAGPPEDCGGVPGYAELIEILADPGHEGHIELVDWLGLDSAGRFDPAAFDPTEVDRALARPRPPSADA